MYPELARAHKVPLIGFILDGVALDRDLMQADGIHPNAAGQPQLLENAWPALETAIQAIAAARGAARRARVSRSRLAPLLHER